MARIRLAQEEWEGLAEICTEGIHLAQQTGATKLEMRLRQQYEALQTQAIHES